MFLSFKKKHAYFFRKYQIRALPISIAIYSFHQNFLDPDDPLTQIVALTHYNLEADRPLPTKAFSDFYVTLVFSNS